MSIFTAHRILIALAAIFFALFAVGKGMSYADDGDLSTALIAALSAVAAVGFAIYYRTIPRR